MFFVIYLQHLAGFRASTVTLSAGAAEPVVSRPSQLQLPRDASTGLPALRLTERVGIRGLMNFACSFEVESCFNY
jgi:hypothetical protein